MSDQENPPSKADELVTRFLEHQFTDWVIESADDLELHTEMLEKIAVAIKALSDISALVYRHVEKAHDR